MAVNPGELPSFDIDFAQNEYDPTRLAEEVLWPLVDLVYLGDWRAESHSPNEMSIVKRGVSQKLGETMDVAITAFQGPRILDVDEKPDANDKPPTTAAVMIELEPIVTDHRRDIILGIAAEHDEDIADALERYEAGHDEYASSTSAAEEPEQYEDDDEEGELEVEELTVKTSFMFRFATDGEYLMGCGKVIEDIEGDVIWDEEISDNVTFTREPEDVDEDRPETIIKGQITKPKLLEHDLDMIEEGLIIFNAPEDILAAIRKIRQNPISS